MTTLTNSLKFTDSLERELIDNESSAQSGNHCSGLDGSAFDWFVAIAFLVGAVLTATIFH